MQVRKIDNTGTVAALYDGALIGDVGDDGRVIPGTAPDWFPALAREWDGKSPTMDVAAGDLIARPDSVLIYVASGAFVEINPGDYIVKRGDRIESMSPVLFQSLYEILPASRALAQQEKP